MTDHLPKPAAEKAPADPRRRIEAREAIFKLEDGSVVQGKINLLAEPPQNNLDHPDQPGANRGASYTRISDLFTSGKNPYIVVFDAIVGGRDGRVLIINKNKILWVSPND
jgi:hypothetical protein